MSRTRRRRPAFTPQERIGNNFIFDTKKTNDQTNHGLITKATASGGALWVDDDILELIKLVKKYPSGTPERWDKIAETMNRTVADVTYMAKKVPIFII